MSAPTVCPILLAVVGLSHGYSFSSAPYHNQGYGMSELNYYQPRALHFYALNDINRPVIYPQLGMNPDYHNLVYKYITAFAGTERPPQVKVEGFPHYHESHDAGKPDKVEEIQATGSSVAAPEKPQLKDHLMPSDFIFLRQNPHNSYSGNVDDIKMGKMNFKENSMTNPPIGGVLSNYVLLRHRPDYQSFIPFSVPSEPKHDQSMSKRQIADDTDDTVVINAENVHNVKMNEEGEESRDQMTDEHGEDDEDQPAVAQSKPAAIALAGPGGVAQASPVGTALVGPGGLAVAAPSGTAVAGPAGQSVISPADDKTKLVQKKIKEVWN